ncbi:MAG: M14 family zinc carboxypeptidase [bacterium]
MRKATSVHALLGITSFALIIAAGIASFAPRAAADDPSTGSVKVFEEVLVTLPTVEDAQRVLREIPEIEWLKPAGDGDNVYRLISTPEIDRQLEALGYRPTIVVADLAAQYESRSLAPGFGGFHTWSEMIAEIDSLAAAHPAIMTPKFSIGQSLEGRDMWAVKISDNPGVDEAEAEVLFDGVTHAREIMTVEMVLHYIRYLLDGYGVDPTATFLVDNREIFFVPVINADGFVYNETTNPNGGGMWRKNRRDNGGGCFGVDLNRNYPYAWGGQGADTNCDSETYRGTGPASEPEVQTMMAFIDSREFVTHQSFHSFAELILHSWGYDNIPQAPDDSLLGAIGTIMARDSGYPAGQAGDLLYNASGNAFDWSYGDTSNHSKIIAYTTEIGGTWFWPEESEMPGLLVENLWGHIYLSQIAGVSLTVTNAVVSGENGNGRLDAGETGNLSIAVTNGGVLQTASGVVATLSSNDPYITLVEAQKSLGWIAAGQTVDLAGTPFVVSVDASCPAGHDAAFTVTLAGDDAYASEDALTLEVGAVTYTYNYAQDFETATDWTQDPTHTATAGAWARIDPNATNYQPGDDATPPPGVFALITAQNPAGNDGSGDVDGGISATRSPVIDLSSVPRARLDLAWSHGQRDATGDPAGDFFRINLSTDGGATYPTSLVALGDGTSQPGWSLLSVRLDSLVTLTNQMRVRVQAADGTASGDIIEGGVDDIFIYDPGDENAAPSAPVAITPTGGAIVGASPALRVSNASDPENDALTYGFRVYSDALLTNVVASITGRNEGEFNTSWTVQPPLAAGDYYWRAFAEDAGQRGLFSAAETFTVETPTGVGAPGSDAGTVSLNAPGPNPTRGAAQIAFSLPTGGRVFIAVVNAEGRVVRIVENGWRAAGRHESSWDGRDASGREVASGRYLLRLEAGSERRTRAITVVR